MFSFRKKGQTQREFPSTIPTTEEIEKAEEPNEPVEAVTEIDEIKELLSLLIAVTRKGHKYWTWDHKQGLYYCQGRYEREFITVRKDIPKHLPPVTYTLLHFSNDIEARYKDDPLIEELWHTIFEEKKKKNREDRAQFIERLKDQLAERVTGSKVRI